MKHPTLKDIAQALHTSVSTVSRAMNDAHDINKETKERILKKARELGYKPNPITRSLHNRKSFQIGVIVPELYSEFFPEVIEGVQETVQEEGYQLLIMQSNEQFKTELENVKRLEEHWVDGLIISLSGEGENIEYYNELYASGMPMVFFNRVNEKLEAPKVVFNDFKWSYLAVEHLIKQGRQRIVHLAGYKHLSLTRERIRGYEKALNKFHLEYDSGCIIETGFSRNQGLETMNELLEQEVLPDAIFAVNDSVALGAIKAIKSKGLDVPNDIAVVGFTESQIADYLEPTLTSVKQPGKQMGREAAAVLLKVMEKKEPLPQQIVLDGALNIRGSSK
ncbi:MAG: LacI family DNA-binding transcriptional regulator [Phaeodactylibacter sp.]|nr:LacI family DNA-binding transcriptional regulator [Phaeodactylibacter sp.]